MSFQDVFDLFWAWVGWGESGKFCCLGWDNLSPENASETVAFYKCISGTFCHWGRKWDILSSGTICRLKNAGGTICRWDKMSPNLTYSEDSSKWIKTQQSSQSFW